MNIIIWQNTSTHKIFMVKRDGGGGGWLATQSTPPGSAPEEVLELKQHWLSCEGEAAMCVVVRRR